MESRNHKITKSIGKMTAVLAVVVLAILVGRIESTNSSFSNRELSSGNYFKATVWGTDNSNNQNEAILMSSLEIMAEEPTGEIIKTTEETLTEEIIEEPVIEEPPVVSEPEVVTSDNPEEEGTQEGTGEDTL